MIFALCGPIVPNKMERYRSSLMMIVDKPLAVNSKGKKKKGGNGRTALRKENAMAEDNDRDNDVSCRDW